MAFVKSLSFLTMLLLLAASCTTLSAMIYLFSSDRCTKNFPINILADSAILHRFSLATKMGSESVGGSNKIAESQGQQESDISTPPSNALRVVTDACSTPRYAQWKLKCCAHMALCILTKKSLIAFAIQLILEK